MPKASQFAGGQFMNVDRVEALSATERTTTIDHIEVEFIANREKLVLYGKGLDFGLPLNTTNIEDLIRATGTDETDDWQGTQVELYIDHGVRYQGRRVGGVRIRIVSPDDTAKE